MYVIKRPKKKIGFLNIEANNFLMIRNVVVPKVPLFGHFCPTIKSNMRYFTAFIIEI